jgi:3-carboxy-cis,cis-muconate cycloisomerase
LTSFAGIFVPASLRGAVSDEAWLTAMLDAERALALVEGRLGLIPAAAAAAIARRCEPGLYDLDRICEEGRAVGNPAEPLVRALREQVGGDEARYVHFAATSQDVLDTAAMLVGKRTAALIDAELGGLALACAGLAREHRDTPIAGRTLLQQAVPTTFGAKAAGWLVGVGVARDGLRATRWLAELGGAAGTLGPLGERGPEVADAFAEELGLVPATAPWHTLRAPLAELGALLDAVGAAAAKIGLDVVLLAQTEVGEVAEAANGGSSTMPHKRNPVKAVLARACARVAHANAAALAEGVYEHERAAGAWQAEWTLLSEALAHAGGAAAAARECLEALEVRPERMRANMTGALYAERDAFVERGLIELDPKYLGSAAAFVDRVLARFGDGR